MLFKLHPIIYLGILFLGFFQPTFEAHAKVTAEDPTQSIRYWQKHRVTESQNSNVLIANQVFDQLLRAWNSNHRFVPPALTVVKSDSGPWAASLEDGNILLSEEALDFALLPNSRHRLAFILSHELAHQQNNDLWHLKFFRLAGLQTPSVRESMLNGLDIDQNKIQDLENREAKADEDGIVLMSLVGFDPFEVIRDKSFFILWAESVWKTSCGINDAPSAICEQARARTLRAKLKLDDIAKKSTVFEMGIQAYVMGNYPLARQWFTEYDKSYSSHIVHDNIGLTYLMEVLSETALDLSVAQYAYPLHLGSYSTFKKNGAQQTMRGIDKHSVTTTDTERVHRLLSQAEPFFKQAIKISPNYKPAYQHLIICYLLKQRVFSANAQLLEIYKPRFGKDQLFNFLSALLMAIDGDKANAIAYFDKILESELKSNHKWLYSSAINLALLYQESGDSNAEHHVWRRLIDRAKKTGDGVLFQQALQQSKPGSVSYRRNPGVQATIEGFVIGDTMPDLVNIEAGYEFWMNGDLYKVFRLPGGRSFVTDHKNIIKHVWQNQNHLRTSVLGVNLNESPDRLLKTLGMPQRYIVTQQGEYLGYDSYGVALNIKNNKISGWFIY